MEFWWRTQGHFSLLIYLDMHKVTKEDFVYSYNEKGQTVKNKVVNFINNGTKDVYKVRTKHVEITGTETHPLLINRDGVIQYVDIKDLIVGIDKIINLKNGKN